MITESIEVAGLRIARGDGDTDPNRIYVQCAESDEWVSFLAVNAPHVISALIETEKKPPPTGDTK